MFNEGELQNYLDFLAVNGDVQNIFWGNAERAILVLIAPKELLWHLNEIGRNSEIVTQKFRCNQK